MRDASPLQTHIDALHSLTFFAASPLPPESSSHCEEERQHCITLIGPTSGPASFPPATLNRGCPSPQIASLPLPNTGNLRTHSISPHPHLNTSPLNTIIHPPSKSPGSWPPVKWKGSSASRSWFNALACPLCFASATVRLPPTSTPLPHTHKCTQIVMLPPLLCVHKPGSLRPPVNRKGSSES